jgi:hypothetical protein
MRHRFPQSYMRADIELPAVADEAYHEMIRLG